MSHPEANEKPTIPPVGSVPVPVWLFVLLGLLGYWGMYYLNGHAGGFHARVYEPYRSFDYVQSFVPKSDADALFANGQRVYATYCSVCHQPTGTGIAGQFPPLAGSDWVNVPEANRIVSLILDGIQGPITVNGQNYNNAMPPWRELLTDDQIAAVVTYIRANASWGNTAAPITPEQVSALRESTAGRSSAWSAAELLAVPLSK